MKNSFIEFELNNEETVNLTLTFRKLNILKSVNNELYQKFNKIFYGRSEDVMDMITLIYVAYWCANFEKDDIYKEQDFIELVPFDMVEIERAFNGLTKPKKK